MYSYTDTEKNGHKLCECGALINIMQTCCHNCSNKIKSVADSITEAATAILPPRDQWLKMRFQNCLKIIISLQKSSEEFNKNKSIIKEYLKEMLFLVSEFDKYYENKS